MFRSLHLLACLSSVAVVVTLSACSAGSIGSMCMSSADCEADLVCVFGGRASSGICIEPDDDPGALPIPYSGNLQLAVNKDVDILFVIDNSGSMGDEQALLATSFGSFINVLEAKDVQANYRLGITTTDNGNPWCNQTTPEAGNLVLSSCMSRLEDFTFDIDEEPPSELICTDNCTLDEAALEILPTTTDFDTQAKPRKWLEKIEGKKNIPDSTDTAEAFKCFAPQGVNGCGFESQLESMYLALLRAQSADEDNYGFLRANAILAVVLVTDEADCSSNKSFSEIFEQGGNRVFWSDPAAQFPTSAVCWNAGVSCSGDPSNYDSCDAINKDVDGTEGVSDAAAVLHPMSRYIGLLNGLEQEKQELNADQEVIVALIGGVSAADGTPIYADASNTDPMFQNSFGIGPGCEAPNPNNPPELAQAVPPVRMRDLVEAFTPGNMFSICSDDYSHAFEAIAQKVRDQIQPACYTKCVDDIDSSTPQVDPQCTVVENPPGNDNTLTVPECARDANGYLTDDAGALVMPSDDTNVCHALLTDNPDEPLTGTTTDDLSPFCADRNYNLEFQIARRSGFPAAGGTSISATCSLTEFPDVSCPGIGG